MMFGSMVTIAGRTGRLLARGTGADAGTRFIGDDLIRFCTRGVAMCRQVLGCGAVGFVHERAGSHDGSFGRCPCDQRGHCRANAAVDHWGGWSCLKSS